MRYAVPVERTVPAVLADFQGSRSSEVMSLRELRRYIDVLQARGHVVRNLVVGFYGRFAFPFACVAFAIVVIPLAVRRRHHFRAEGFLLILPILIAYWIVHAVGLAAAKADLLPPLLGAWMSNLAFTGLGTAAFLRARTRARRVQPDLT